MNKTLEFTQENFEELQRQNALLKEQNGILTIENDGYESQIKSLKGQRKVSPATVDVLRLFADPHNWKGNTWSPFDAHVERDYPDMIASRALEAA